MPSEKTADVWADGRDQCSAGGGGCHRGPIPVAAELLSANVGKRDKGVGEESSHLRVFIAIHLRSPPCTTDIVLAFVGR